jgi:hypothetical protein
MPKYEVTDLGIVGVGMWGSIPEKILREALAEYRRPPPSNVQPPILPEIERHPPTLQEWKDSLPWVMMADVIPMDWKAPDKGKSRVRFVGYRDEITTAWGSPLHLRFPRFVLLPKDE